MGPLRTKRVFDAKRWGAAWLAGTALATAPSLVIAGFSGAIVTTLTASPALAAGGNGGGAPSVGIAGGSGGTGFAGAAGGNGGTDGADSGGGGGGAAGGGTGGSGGAIFWVGTVGAPGGAGGTSVSPDGQAGSNPYPGLGGGGGGGGGGWNGNGAGAATLTNASSLSGGNGGDGGYPYFLYGTGGGGGGGGGGYGAIVTGSGASSNTGTITGGTGGAGNFGIGGGNGGDGGVGVQFTASGATFTNSGTVMGGDGGAGGPGGGRGVRINGIAGAGGAGIIGSGLTIINSGTIAGGLSGTRANAVTFTGGSNVLELQAGSTITGNVVAFSTADTLRLGGTSNASFDVSQIGASAQYQGFGLFVKAGSSTWTLTGTTTATTPWTIDQGMLAISADNDLGAASGGLTFGGGTLQFLSAFTTARTVTLNAGGGSVDTDGNNDTLSGAISGTGGLTKIGTGTLTLSGVSSYTGATNVEAGTLQAGATGVFAPSSAFTAALGRTLDLNSFSQTIGSLAGAGNVTLGSATLTTGNDGTSTSLSGAISGTGGLTKIGVGTFTLSGTNTYTGTTTVFGGVLDVEGSIASSVLTTVNAGGTLTGAGTVGNTTIATGGIFLPGNGPPGSSTTVAGNLAFQSGALYLVQFNSVTSTFANVTGTATLAGTVGASFAAGSTVMKQYMIMTFAGGRSGTFDDASVIGGGSALVATVSYDPKHAYLNFALNFGATPGLTVNQQKVGTALSNFFNTNGTIPAAFAALTPAGLTQASGELATGTQQATFEAMNLFMGLLTDPFINGRGAGGTGSPAATPFAAEDSASAYAARQSNAARDAFAKFPTKAEAARDDLFDPRWSVWGASYGGGSTTSGNTALGSNNTTARAFGVVAGADYRISPVTLAGFALAGGGTNFGVNGFGTGRSDMFQVGAFVQHTVGSAYVTGALAYGWQAVTTDRTVTTAGIDQLHAQFNANAFSGRVEAGNRYLTPWMGITPYGAGQFTTYSLPAYAEQVLAGAGTFALNYAAKDVTDPRTELGIRTDRSFAMQDGILTLRGRFAWAHDFYTDRNISAVFQTLPGASFVVNGAAQAHDSALTTASIEKKWLNGWSAAATFEGEFSSVTASYAGKGVVRYAW